VGNNEDVGQVIVGKDRDFGQIIVGNENNPSRALRGSNRLLTAQYGQYHGVLPPSGVLLPPNCEVMDIYIQKSSGGDGFKDTGNDVGDTSLSDVFLPITY
jgi:hypothetical protein